MTSSISKIKYSVILLLFTLPVFSQQVDFDRVVTPIDFKAKTFEDYLVQLAWRNNPANKILALEVAVAKEEENIQRWDWTKDLTAQFNYNEAHFITDFFPPEADDSDPLVQSLIFPRFNFGAQISLGTILNYKNEKQIAKLKTEIAETHIDEEKLRIRKEVLETYEEFKTSKETTKLRLQAEEDANQSYQLATTLFKKGEAKMEEFTGAADSYFNAREATLESRSKEQIARITLEELIGVSYEEAKRFGPKEEVEEKKNKKRKKRQ
ncbi:MAG: TolC family protein [Saprospiraceae bacterium]